MAEIVEGGSFSFTVVAKNKFGTVVAISDASVTASAGTASVDADGKNGVFAGPVGVSVLTAAAGGKTSDAFPVEVKADTTVATVEIVPDVATVEIVPA